MASLASTLRVRPGSAPGCDMGRLEPQRWYSFSVANVPSIIPSICVKNNLCGTEVGMYIDYGGEISPTTIGEIKEFTLCGSYNVLGKYDCCVLRLPVLMSYCGMDRFVYRFPKPIDRCPVAICITELSQPPPDDVFVSHGQDFREADDSDEAEAQNVREDEPVVTPDMDKAVPTRSNKAGETATSPSMTTLLTVPASSDVELQTPSDLAGKSTHLTTVQDYTSTEILSDETIATHYTMLTASNSPEPTDVGPSEGTGTTLVSDNTSYGSDATIVQTDAISAATDGAMSPTTLDLQTSSSDHETHTETLFFETSATTEPNTDITPSDAATGSLSSLNSYSVTSSTPLTLTENTTSMDAQATETGTITTAASSVISTLNTSLDNATRFTSSSLPSSTEPSSSISPNDTMATSVWNDTTSDVDTTNQSVTSESPSSEITMAVSNKQSDDSNSTLTTEGFTESFTEGSTQLTTDSLVPLSLGYSTGGQATRPATSTDPTTTSPPNTATSSVTDMNTSHSTSITTDVSDTATSVSFISEESTPTTLSQTSIDANSNEPSQSMVTTDAPSLPTASVTPTPSPPTPTQDQSPEEPSERYPSSSSAPPTTTQSKESTEKNQSDFHFNDDVILVEKVRLVFLGIYENDTVFASETEAILARFLLAATRLQKSKAGTDWWFELHSLGQGLPQLYRNTSTFLDFQIKHSSGEEILETFDRHHLKRYFKDQENLTLVAECRPSQNCQRSAAAPALTRQSHFWEKHGAIFLTVLVLSAAIFLALMVGFLGGKCRDRWWRRGTYDAARDDYEGYDSKPLSSQTKLRPVSGVSGGMSSPFSDAQITRHEVDTAKLGEDPDEQETAFLTRGHGDGVDGVDGGQGAAGDGDTWVIPLEEAPGPGSDTGHAGNGHTETLQGPVVVTNARAATTTIQGRNDAFVSTRF
ncbi:hypothetical protein EGW08_011082 [Elysia chlorotica]|uniref:Uncharacterized protein n=1 Tax=Elysia chlorotica TaxID=188477 RepID=A0A3S0ZKQ2_ELYCH|nr:hypothetical protein EGW08_011082 [Elysia chlorotica]